ncbi:hypothetical protein, partial [Catellatospora coxensis]|uniref:WXG100 family type VII secretion target n=2 Tax=Catellatospora coxensis TaxID=310354 RepID=UPI0031D83A4B
MDEDIPEWMRRFFLVVTGESWPQAVARLLWALGRLWAKFEQLLAAVEEELAAIEDEVGGAGWKGETAEAVRARFAQLIDGGGLRKLVEAAGKVSRFVDDAGTNVEYTKASIIGQLA